MLTLFDELGSELHIIIFFTDPKILKYHFMVSILPIFEDSDYLFINSCFSVLTAYFHAFAFSIYCGIFPKLMKMSKKCKELLYAFFFDVEHFLNTLLSLLQYCFCFMFYFVLPRGMWDLRALAWDRTCIPFMGRRRLSPGSPGKSQTIYIWF